MPPPTRRQTRLSNAATSSPHRTAPTASTTAMSSTSAPHITTPSRRSTLTRAAATRAAINIDMQMESSSSSAESEDDEDSDAEDEDGGDEDEEDEVTVSPSKSRRSSNPRRRNQTKARGGGSYMTRVPSSTADDESPNDVAGATEQQPQVRTGTSKMDEDEYEEEVDARPTTRKRLGQRRSGRAARVVNDDDDDDEYDAVASSPVKPTGTEQAMDVDEDGTEVDKHRQRTLTKPSKGKSRAQAGAGGARVSKGKSSTRDALDGYSEPDGDWDRPGEKAASGPPTTATTTTAGTPNPSAPPPPLTTTAAPTAPPPPTAGTATATATAAGNAAPSGGGGISSSLRIKLKLPINALSSSTSGSTGGTATPTGSVIDPSEDTPGGAAGKSLTWKMVGGRGAGEAAAGRGSRGAGGRAGGIAKKGGARPTRGGAAGARGGGNGSGSARGKPRGRYVDDDDDDEDEDEDEDVDVESEDDPDEDEEDEEEDVDVDAEDDDDEEDDDDDEDGGGRKKRGGASRPSPTKAKTGRAAKPARPLTTRQAVLASMVDSSHIALDESGLPPEQLVADVGVMDAGNKRRKKKELSEMEIALRREETARKRKNLSEKKLEDEKAETINRLLKKQTKPRARRTNTNNTDSPLPGSSTPAGGRSGTRTPAVRSGNKLKSSATASTTGVGEDADADANGEEGLENVDEENEEGEWDEGEDGAESEKKEEMKPTTMFRWVSRVVIEKVKLPGTTGADGMDVDAKEEEVKKMVLSFSVPESLLPVGSRDAKNEEAPPGKGGDAMEVDNDTSVLAAAPTPQHPATSTAAHTTQLPPLVPPAPQTCAIEGCREKRKYRWVKDWTVGACGMGHLKLLDSGAGRATVGV